MALATPTRWRLVLLTSALLSLLQVLVSTGIAESPAWLAGNGKAQEARAVRSSLWDGEDTSYESVADDPDTPIRKCYLGLATHMLELRLVFYRRCSGRP